MSHFQTIIEIGCPLDHSFGKIFSWNIFNNQEGPLGDYFKPEFMSPPINMDFTKRRITAYQVLTRHFRPILKLGVPWTIVLAKYFPEPSSINKGTIYGQTNAQIQVSKTIIVDLTKI